MSKRVTNLRAKDGTYLDLSNNGDRIRLISGSTVLADLLSKNFEFDEVVPEYQVGDLVAVRHVENQFIKGFIHMKYPNGDFGICDVDGNVCRVGTCSVEIVGLWDEEKTQ